MSRSRAWANFKAALAHLIAMRQAQANPSANPEQDVEEAMGMIGAFTDDYAMDVIERRFEGLLKRLPE